MHVAAASTPVAEQLVGPDTPYPALHVGWHCAPAARALVQEPRSPLDGAVTAHGAYVGEAVGLHVIDRLIRRGAACAFLPTRYYG